MGDIADYYEMADYYKEHYWADDDEFDYEARYKYRNYWTDKEGNRHKIKEMEDGYLLNTERYLRTRNMQSGWPQYDVIVKQMEKRGLKPL